MKTRSRFQHIIRIVTGLGILLSLAGPAHSESSGPPAEGAVFPKITLPAPPDAAHRKWLGLAEEKPFSATDIRADILIVQIYSMYCPHCQKDAPRVNELYRKITASAALKDRVRLIGIGVGNSRFEVEFFRKSYSVLFPLFPDTDFSLHKTLGEVRTPYFIVIHLQPDQSGRVLYSKLGSIENQEKFLEMIAGKLK